MADQFTLSGQYQTSPSVGAPSGFPAVITPLLEQFNIIAKHVDTVTLSADATSPLSFGGVTQAHVLIFVATGGPIQVAMTSTYGTLQVIPCDDLLIIISKTTIPVTAVNLTRTPGVSTTVQVFLGQIQ